MEEDSIRISKAASDETNSSIFCAQLALSFNVPDKNIYVDALKHILDIIVNNPKSIETINENDIVDLLNKLLNSCQEGEVYILSNSIMNVIGLQSGVVDAVVRARAATEPLIQIIYSPSEKQSKAGSKTLSDLIIENETIRNSLLTTGFVELVLHTLTSNNQIQSKSSSSSSDIIPIFIKIGLLDIVLKLVTTARGLQPLSLLIPILEELQLSGEDELINKSKIILNNLKVEGIKASSSTQIKEKINEILRLSLIGTQQQQQQQILKQQEDECNKLITRIKDQIDEEGKLDIIKSGIVEILIQTFQSRPFDLITKPYSSLFYVLTYPSSNEVNLQLYNIHPYPSLIRLLNHENTNVVNDAIISIFNILASGSYVTLSKSLHPHFDSISDCDGINQIYKIFKRKDIQKDIKDTIAELFGHLYRAREITNIKIRKDIIAHLKSLIMKKDKDEMTHSIHALKRLAPNVVNRTEIEKDGFVIPDK
ncbi:MAG: hypothetical protein EZS28_007814 [Streblomastix strix]|uniref:Uncharacterized protein n=1 Tax=Streblomastix strix TaxID=222440 RepID=A0A5J4WPA1_9EUKA|nr:MAG: hypothetical protein EZS28_007814 [Streblomastix strix]